ncbi:MAG: glycoside hydrolase family 3 [Lachnospiraceae bacterium]|nr:glycoside hydrolase family 3 [Lachnospiraceae bacterium]
MGGCGNNASDTNTAEVQISPAADTETEAPEAVSDTVESDENDPDASAPELADVSEDEPDNEEKRASEASEETDTEEVVLESDESIEPDESLVPDDEQVDIEDSQTVTSDVDGNDVSPVQVIPHELNYGDDIDTIIASMSLHEKICQMIIVTPAVLTGSSKVTSADSMQIPLGNYPVGGLILDKSNIVSGAQLSGMISQAQGYMTIPLIVTLDEEGGRVTRLMGTVGTTPVGPMYSYHELGPEVASFNAMTIGNDIRRFGFNMDLAPVADVWSNPNNTVIGDRAYSTDFDEASTLVSAAVTGFHMSGVACCIKHFPGHGDTSADSHYGSVYVYKTLDEMRTNEFKPFISGINSGADAVMIGHLIVADQGNVPALFSYPLITGVLRHELGFNGVVISDSLQMKAMTDHYGAADIPVMAVVAGCDILLMPTDLEVTVSSLEAAVQNGVISEERINESVRRILILKKKYI